MDTVTERENVNKILQSQLYAGVDNEIEVRVCNYWSAGLWESERNAERPEPRWA